MENNTNTNTCCKKNTEPNCCKIEPIVNTPNTPNTNDLTITMDNIDLTTETLQNTDTLNRISNKIILFYPLILTFIFVISGALITQYPLDTFNSEHFMYNLMGILLITFSYLKMLNLKGFKLSFSKYDLIAYYVPLYGDIYPLIEFTLGLFYCIKVYPIIINSIAILFLTINLVEVCYAILQKKQLECACMGSLGFKLPLSYITITEDLFMIIMACIMIGIH